MTSTQPILMTAGFPPRQMDGAKRKAARNGAALVVAMICVLLVSLISAVLVKTALVQRDQLEHDAWQVQADWLAHSAFDLATARLESDAAYTGETWSPATALGTPIGRVVIEIAPAPDGDAAARLVRATADVPDDPVNRARVIREWRVPTAETSVSSSAPAVIE